MTFLASRCPSAERAVFPLNQYEEIVIDTERKVTVVLPTSAISDCRKNNLFLCMNLCNGTHIIQTIKSRLKEDSLFHAEYIDNGSTGRGNNWSYGYHDSRHMEEIMETFRKRMEASFFHQGIMMVHSIAGGTGSGLGSRIAQSIKEEYPKKALFSAAVAPFSAGETALQHYNALLTLGWMNEFSDIIALYQNDQIMNIAQRQYALLNQNAAGQISMHHINDYISNSLADLLLPMYPSCLDEKAKSVRISSKPRPFSLWDLIQDVVPIEQCKFIQCNTSYKVFNKPLQSMTKQLSVSHFYCTHSARQ